MASWSQHDRTGCAASVHLILRFITNTFKTLRGRKMEAHYPAPQRFSSSKPLSFTDIVSLPAYTSPIKKSRLILPPSSFSLRGSYRPAYPDQRFLFSNRSGDWNFFYVTPRSCTRGQHTPLFNAVTKKSGQENRRRSRQPSSSPVFQRSPQSHRYSSHKKSRCNYHVRHYLS